MAGITVGVTFYLHDGDRSIWINGGTQNVAFLTRLLRQCPGVKRVIPINGGPGKVSPKGMLLDNLGFDFVKFDEVKDELDLLIECGAQIHAREERHVHANGGKVVGYKFGNAFLIDSEKLLKNDGDRLVFNGTQHDAVWTNPQHMATNASYWEACYRAPVVSLPHVWEPIFIEVARAELAKCLAFEYTPGPGRKDIAIYEPNINILKTCQIPLVICDLVYRLQPELIGAVYATNTAKFKDQLTFKGFCGALDISRAKAKDGKTVLSWEPRYIFPFFQAKFADIIVSWQWENALNYFYYEALCGHYPLVHNSDLLPDGVGYRYRGFDAHDGAKALLAALTEHDAHREEYNATADAFLETMHPNYAPNIATYQSAIDDVMAA